jgi:hypothetical protein
MRFASYSKVKKLCNIIYSAVSTKFPDYALTSVGSLFFLRLVFPYLLTTEQIEGGMLRCVVWHGVGNDSAAAAGGGGGGGGASYANNHHLSSTVTPKLLVVSKVIQVLSNHVEFSASLPHYEPLNASFLRPYLGKMKHIQFQLAVCASATTI